MSDDKTTKTTNEKEQTNDCIPTIRVHSECNDTITTTAPGDDNDCTPTIRMHSKLTSHRTNAPTISIRNEYTGNKTRNTIGDAEKE